MAINQIAFNNLVQSIRDGSYDAEEICLPRNEINDRDAANLFAALKANPTVARRIKKIDLRHNPLTSINIASTLVALQELFIYDNRLIRINIPATLVALRYLDLSWNFLTSINIPATLAALRYLFLQKNQLTSINISATLVALQTLVLRDNPLSPLARKMLLSMRTVFRACNIIFNEAEQQNEPITQEMLIQWRARHFTPSGAVKGAMTLQGRKYQEEAIKHITSTLLIWSKNTRLGSRNPAVYKIIEYLLPGKEDIKNTLRAYSLAEFFNNLPAGLRLHEEMMQGLRVAEDAVVSQAIENLAFTQKKHIDIINDSAQFQFFQGLNKWLEEPDSCNVKGVLERYNCREKLGSFLVSNGFSTDLKYVNKANVAPGNTGYSYTPLTFAVKSKNIRACFLLIEYAKADVNSANTLGNTALHIAMDAREVLIIKMLIKKGAKLDVANNKGETPLDIENRIMFEDNARGGWDGLREALGITGRNFKLEKVLANIKYSSMR